MSVGSVTTPQTPVTPLPKASSGIIQKAEDLSQKNKNTKSIFGDTLSLDDAKAWLKVNPFLAQSPRLLELVDFNTNGLAEADELVRGTTAKVVVLNGIRSYHVPGETQSGTAGNAPPAKAPMSAQEKYYQQKLDEQKTREKYLAMDAGAAVVGAGASTLLDLIFGR